MRRTLVALAAAGALALAACQVAPDQLKTSNCGIWGWVNKDNLTATFPSTT